MSEPLDNCPNLIKQAVQDGVRRGELPSQDRRVDYDLLAHRRQQWLKEGECPCYPPSPEESPCAEASPPPSA